VSNRFRADFAPQELATVLARYDLGDVKHIERQVKGSRRSPKVIITCTHGRFLLKRRGHGRDHPLKVAYAHGIQQYLARQGFPLAKLIPVRKGDDTMVIHNGHIYEMFEYVHGEPYHRLISETFDAGRVLGMFHRLVRGYDSDWVPSRRGYHDTDIVRECLNSIPMSIGKNDSAFGRETELLTTVNILYDAYETAVEKVSEAGFREWYTQTVHSDWHPGNMVFLDGHVAAVIDYDSLHILPPITDLANGALQFSIIGGPTDPREWPPELDRERVRRFLMGYELEIATAPEQIAVLPWLMVEALIAEAVAPIAATGSFGRMEGFRFLQMICRKVGWLQENGERLAAMLQPR
jgi:prepilin-type processing-associated H-X9-DG protein